MLANVLAVLLGLGSFIFYMTAFVYPEVHRRSDFLWSGLGLFYAVVLWFCAGQMTGALLLGQLTAVGLLFGLGWQTLSVRREKTPVYQQTPIVITPEVVGDWAKSKLNQLRMVPAESVPVRLEKRMLAAQDQRLDPRRRLAYEYEFVEDGEFTEDSALVEESDLEPGLEALPVSERRIEPSDDLDHPIPPSVAAAVISVEGPEPSAVEISADEADDTAEAELPTALPETDLPDVEASEPERVESGAESDGFELDGSELETAEVESPADKSLEAQRALPEDDWADSEDWVDDLSAIAPENTTEKTVQTSAQKPSLLATPLILVGWIKDVVAALARPKPAKPVIDIPRRESPASVATRDERSPQPQPSDRSPEPDFSFDASENMPATAPTTVQTEDASIESTSIEDDLPDSNWEESNWDD
ncbi:MAG: Ycf66 family protein [Phormidesmis sp.]